MSTLGVLKQQSYIYILYPYQTRPDLRAERLCPKSILIEPSSVLRKPSFQN